MNVNIEGPTPSRQQVQTSSWWQILLVGTLLYFTGMAILAATYNSILFPLVAFLGSFTVPVSYVAFFYDRRGTSRVTLTSIAFCFFYGGVLGAFAASLLEPVFVKGFGPVGVFQIGLIEEFAKIFGVLMIARHTRHTSMMSGIILGAAAGMGFAAFESNGYTFVQYLSTQGNLASIAEITVLRGLLAPIGHGTWTAILAGILFRQSAPGRFRFDVNVISAYLGVSLLHGLWNGVPMLLVAAGFTKGHVFAVQMLIGALGLAILESLWRESKWHQVSEDRRAELEASAKV
jgi:RsiW-degrading membrane proteinase PrsW (M82 family)